MGRGLFYAPLSLRFEIGLGLADHRLIDLDK